jgi:hypothetical protein
MVETDNNHEKAGPFELYDDAKRAAESIAYAGESCYVTELTFEYADSELVEEFPAQKKGEYDE